MAWLHALALESLPALALFGLWVSLHRTDSTQDDLAAVAAAVLGPSAWMAVLELTYRIAPGNADGVYLATPYVVFGFILMVTGKAAGSRLRPVFAKATNAFRRAGPAAQAGVLALVALGGLSAAVGALAPLEANDALEYAHSARLMYRAQSVAGYPFLDSTRSGGYYGPWTHPLDYVLHLVWGFLAAGSDVSIGIGKWAAATALGRVVLVAAFAARRAGGTASLLAAAMALGTPLLTQLAIQSHIDPGRLPAWLLAFLLAGELARGFHRGTAVLFGLALAAAMYAHSIGILAPVLASFAYVAVATGPWLLRLRVLVIANGIATLFLAPQFLRNWRDFGSPVADFAAVPVYQAAKLGFAEYFRAARESETLGDKLLKLSALFWRWNTYGVASAACVLAPLTARQAWRRLGPEIRAFAVGAVGYLTMALVASVLGSDAFVKNDRYLLTVCPMLAVVAGAWLAQALPTLRHRLGLGSFPLVPVAAVALVVAFTLLPTMRLARSYGATLYGRPAANGVRPLDRPQYVAVAFANKRLRPGDCVLNFRQGDFVNYSRQCTMSHLDPRLLPVYAATDADGAARELRKLGLTHVLLPPYEDPAWTQSALNELLLDPARASLIADFDGYRWFALRQNENATWSKVPLVPLAEGAATTPFRQESADSFGLAPKSDRFRRDVTFVLGDQAGEAPRIPTRQSIADASPQFVFPDDWLVLEATAQGKGARLRLDWLCYTFGSLAAVKTVWEGGLTDTPRRVGAAFHPPIACTSFRYQLKIRRPNGVEITGLRAFRVEEQAPK